MNNPPKVELIECNICGSKSFKPYYKEGQWQIVKCKSCGHCYTNPRPTIDSLPFYYTKEYFGHESFANFYDDYIQNNSDIPKKEINTSRIAEIEQFFDQRGTLLEIGAARGDFLKSMQQIGCEVEGIE